MLRNCHTKRSLGVLRPFIGRVERHIQVFKLQIYDASEVFQMRARPKYLIHCRYPLSCTKCSYCSATKRFWICIRLTSLQTSHCDYLPRRLTYWIIIHLARFDNLFVVCKNRAQPRVYSAKVQIQMSGVSLELIPCIIFDLSEITVASKKSYTFPILAFSISQNDCICRYIILKLLNPVVSSKVWVRAPR